MPRQFGTVVENNFTRGLITESTALQFPQNACTDALNCVFDETGRITRRLGLDYEESYDATTITNTSTDVFTEFVWTSVGGDGNKTFVVQQVGAILRFYDVSSSSILGDNIKGFTVDLTDHIPTGSTLDPDINPCQYAVGDGDLIVVNRATDPIFVVYDATTDTITDTAISIKIRDFRGLNDGLDLLERITSTVAGLVTSNPAHYYNLINQGWHTGDALTQWDTALTTVPSNADQVGFFRSSATDAFDSAIVTSKSGLNSPAPKGHFILDAFSPDRVTALTDEGFSSVTFSGSVILNPFISEGTGGTIGTAPSTGSLPLVGPFSMLFDGLTSQNFNPAAGGNLPGWTGTDVYYGKDFSADPLIISKAIVYGSNSRGFSALFSGGSWVNAGGTVTLSLYGGSTLPASSSDGTLLGSISFTQSANESGGRTIFSNDVITEWEYVWVRLQCSTGTARTSAEAQFFTYDEQAVATSDDIFTYERPSTVEFFQGRVFYSGVPVAGVNGNVYFSHIIERRDQYGQCYQKNDPTGEDFFDLLADDGGLIKIPDAGNIVRLYQFQGALLVIATNGVWIIQGSAGAPFTATDYEVRKISSSGSYSQFSITSYRSVPVWWGLEGLFTVKYDPNYTSFTVENISDTTVRSFIDQIPLFNRRFIKGVCDTRESVIYWLYNDIDPLSSDKYYVYTKVLCLNMLSGAFYPWEFTDDHDISIRGLVWIEGTGLGNFDNRIKYVTSYVDSTNIELIYAEATSDTYTDWASYAADISSDEDDEIDYSSYFITGYRLDGETMRFFQPAWVMVFLEQEDDASCYMQGIFDYTTSGNTGKWSTTQQIYNVNLLNRAVNFRRLKVRGKGRALQLRFESEAGKPFTIIGWSILESAHAAV